jgi:hypothetical protein
MAVLGVARIAGYKWVEGTAGLIFICDGGTDYDHDVQGVEFGPVSSTDSANSINTGVVNTVKDYLAAHGVTFAPADTLRLINPV